MAKKAKRSRKLVATRPTTHGDFTDVADFQQQVIELAMTKPSWKNLSRVQRSCLGEIAHKMGRIVSGNPDFPDHWDDISGYGHLASDRIKKRR
jgi:hypothetical protein